MTQRKIGVGLNADGVAESTIQGKFIGEVTAIPTIPDTVTEATGIVLLYMGETTEAYTKGKYYSYDGSQWTEYKSADIQEIWEELDKKVDKEEGKGLSSNDFTDAYKEKLDGIEDKAEVNIIETVKVDDVALPVNESREVNIDLSDYAKQKWVEDNYVPNTRQINGKALGEDIALTAEDVGALTKEQADELYATLDQIEDKQEEIISVRDVPISAWVEGFAQGEYKYRATVPITGCTSDMIPQVVFGYAEATSGSYLQICESITDGIYIWSKRNIAITVKTAFAIPQDIGSVTQ